MPYRDGRVVQWKKKINIKQYLGGGGDVEEIKKAAAGIVAELEKLYPAGTDIYEHDEELWEILEEFRYFAEHGQNPDTCCARQRLEDFNGWLSQLYDWADAELVWLGM